MGSLFSSVMYGKKDPGTKKKYMWYSMGSISFAFSTFLMTIVISRVMGENIAGMFSIGLSLAQWLTTIAYFEIRTYQVTDVKNEYSFSEYLQLRIFMCIVAFAACIGYALLNGYSDLKLQVVILICVYKLTEAFADVCEGEFQKEDRIDAAGKSEFFRVAASMVALVIFAYVSKNIIVTLIAMDVVAVISVLCLDVLVTGSNVGIRFGFAFGKMMSLIVSCVPLAISSFFHNYIINSSKLAVDKVLGDVQQLYYTAIFMPNLVINLFSGIIFKPMQTSMAKYYDEKEWDKFFKVIYKMVAIIMSFTFVCMAGAYLLGIPVLAFVYKADLTGCRLALLLLLLCGGINAVNIIMYYVLAILRRQSLMTVLYLIASAVALIIITPLVKAFGLTGAALGYLIVVAVLLVLLLLYIIYAIRKERKNG